jgi:hypothetical protein
MLASALFVSSIPSHVGAQTAGETVDYNGCMCGITGYPDVSYSAVTYNANGSLTFQTTNGPFTPADQDPRMADLMFNMIKEKARLQNSEPQN